MPRVQTRLPSLHKRSVVPPKRVERPVEYMLESGMIYELNRTFFHPQGLILTVSPPLTTGGDMRLNLLDNTHNPVTVFDPNTYKRGKSRWDEFKKLAYPVTQLRYKLLGFVVQLKPDFREQTNRSA